MSGFVINEDNSHYFYDRGANGANEASLRKLALRYCAGQCVEVVYNLNAMRSSVAGLPFEPIWTDVEIRGADEMFFHGRRIPDRTCKWLSCARELSEKGIDSYQVWLDETRRQGRRACLSIRMNDIHCVDDEDSFMHSTFWREHPQFRREPGELFHGWNSAALDYSHPEVRDYALKMVLAVVERYDADGFELDWMRFGHHVRPGFEDLTRDALTDFLAQIHNAVKGRAAVLGHPVGLSVRCPALPQEAFDMGYDVVEWARKGLVDCVVPSPFFTTTDFAIPVSFWRKILPDNIRIDAGIDVRITAVPGWGKGYILQSPATLCALASTYFSQGADRIYLFNHMDSDSTMPAGYDEIFSCVGELNAASAHERRHIVTYHDAVSCGSSIQACLPLTCWEKGNSEYLRLDVGPAPEPGRKVELIIGLEDGTAELIPVLNGVELASTQVQANADDGRMSTVALKGFSYLRQYPQDVKKLLLYDAAPAVKGGCNVVWFKNRSTERINVIWAELRFAGKETENRNKD